MVNLPSDPKPYFSSDTSRPTIVSADKQKKIVRAAIKVIKRNQKLIEEWNKSNYEVVSQ